MWPPLRTGRGSRSAPDVAHASRRTWPPLFAPEGRRYIARGVSPWTANATSRNQSSPGRGDSPAEDALSPLPGLGRRGMTHSPGLTPRAMDYRPSGAKRGIIPSMETRIFNCVTSTSSNLFSRSALDIAPASRRTWPPLRARTWLTLRAGRGSRSRRTWPPLRPGGAAVNSQGRQPLDGQRNVKNIQPRQGRQSRRGRPAAPAGAGKTRDDRIPGAHAPGYGRPPLRGEEGATANAKRGPRPTRSGAAPARRGPRPAQRGGHGQRGAGATAARSGRTKGTSANGVTSTSNLFSHSAPDMAPASLLRGEEGDHPEHGNENPQLRRFYK